MNGKELNAWRKARGLTVAEHWRKCAEHAERRAVEAVEGKPADDDLATANLRVWQNVAARFWDQYQDAQLRKCAEES